MTRRRELREKITKENLIDLRNRGMTVAEIAEYFDVSRGAIEYRVAKYDLHKPLMSKKDLKKVYEMAKDHTADEIAEICNVDIHTVRAWFKEAGTKPLPGKIGKRKYEVDLDYIKRQFASGMRLSEIAESLGMSAETIKLRFREAGEDWQECIKNLPRWAVDIKRYYGVLPDDMEHKPGTIGKNCMRSPMRSCKYCSGRECVYLSIEGHKRPSNPWNCTDYMRASVSEKRRAQSSITVTGGISDEKFI